MNEQEKVEAAVEDIMRLVWMHIAEGDIWAPDLIEALQARLKEERDEFIDSLPAPEEWDDFEEAENE